MKDKLKTAAIFVGLILFAVAVNWGAYTFRSSIASYPMTQADYKELVEHIIEHYKMNESINRQLGQVHGDYQRVTHYVSGHDFRQPTDFCPECALLFEINKRKEEVNQRTIILAEEQEELKQSGLKDSKEYKDKTDEINRLTIEAGLINKHLYSADQRAIEVNKVMRKHRLIGGNFNPDPKGN